MSLNLEQLTMLRDLHKGLDSVIEELQLNHANLEGALGKIFLYLNEKIKAAVFYVETQDENLNNRVFCFGRGDDNIKRKTPQLLKIDRASTFNTPGMFWTVQPIEMGSTHIGSIGLAFESEFAPAKDLAPEILDTVSELVDNFFYGIHTNRLKHSLIMGIQSALKSHSIVDSIDGAVYVLKKEIPFKKMILLYSDHELTGNSNMNYLVYEGYSRVYDSSETPHAGLDEFVKDTEGCLSANIEELRKVLGDNDLMVSYLLDGLIEEDLIGKVIFVPESGATFSIFCREIIQVFTETLRQRLVDFNRERNSLRKFFSDKVIAKLISEPGYEKLHLKERQTDIGIIFADISGFTKMSEQILVSPERITSLIDHWSNAIITRVFPLGACLDKLVGDCVILLFGPPFYSETPEQIAENVVKAAEIIIEVTRDVFMMPEYEDIRKHADFNKFGVAIGVNYCPAVVGLIGPNDDLTAFSSGMNITARLQGLAKANQILVTERLHDLIKPMNMWHLEGPECMPVKNVEKPLVYYRVTPKK
ncbi:MAG: adenylate/guanylate cyclase domain-containing protein [Candidatus Riflebacteria bacterium]|nr:adenylate/guanylate cyclase domain-containing protein [Candidatus Riflebacteria bacterium]